MTKIFVTFGQNSPKEKVRGIAYYMQAFYSFSTDNIMFRDLHSMDDVDSTYLKYIRIVQFLLAVAFFGTIYILASTGVLSETCEEQTQEYRNAYMIIKIEKNYFKNHQSWFEGPDSTGLTWKWGITQFRLLDEYAEVGDSFIKKKDTLTFTIIKPNKMKYHITWQCEPDNDPYLSVVDSSDSSPVKK